MARSQSPGGCYSRPIGTQIVVAHQERAPGFVSSNKVADVVKVSVNDNVRMLLLFICRVWVAPHRPAACG
jgi:hypothetical protein